MTGAGSTIGTGEGARRVSDREHVSWDVVFDGVIPDLAIADDPAIRATPAVVRRLVLHLGRAADALAGRIHVGGPVVINADVLVIDGPVVVDTNRLIIHARRIEVGAEASITVNPPAAPAETPVEGLVDTTVEVTVGQWVGDSLDTTVAGFTHRLDETLAMTSATIACRANGSIQVIEEPAALPGDPAMGLLQLDAAKRLAHRPDLDDDYAIELAIDIVRWVAATSPDRLLADDARAYAALVATPKGRRHHVPIVHLDGYLALAESAARSLGQVELHVGQVVGEVKEVGVRRQAAEDLLSRYQSEKEFSDRLLGQSYQQTSDAADALETARQLLTDRGGEVEAAEAVFRQGVEDKQDELEAEAAWSIVGAIVGVGVGVAAVCLTAGAAAPAAAGTAVAATQVAKAGAETAAKMQRLIELIKKIADLLDAIQKIMAYFALLAEMFSDIAEGRDARARAEAAGEGLPEPPSDADLMSAADWEEFEVTLEAAFEPALAFEIDGATAYLGALKKLAIRGRDYTAKRDELDSSQRMLQQHLWQTLRDEEIIESVRRSIAEIDDERGPGLVLLGAGSRLRDRLKYRLIGAILGLADAYRYEALDEPGFRPAITDTGLELLEDVTAARDALLQAKTERGAVGSWNDRVPVSGGALDSLRRDASAGWAVNLGSFPGFERVRIDGIEVWLGGDLGVDRVHVAVTNSGDYVDRSRGEVFEFSTRPLRRVFAYEFRSAGPEADPWGRAVGVISRADDAEGDFFQPSAFTTWRIELPTRLNPGLRLDAITDLEVRFKGTALPDLVGSTAGMAERALGSGLGLGLAGSDTDFEKLAESLDADQGDVVEISSDHDLLSGVTEL